jgi:hypothetical protein
VTVTAVPIPPSVKSGVVCVCVCVPSTTGPEIGGGLEPGAAGVIDVPVVVAGEVVVPWGVDVDGAVVVELNVGTVVVIVLEDSLDVVLVEGVVDVEPVVVSSGEVLVEVTGLVVVVVPVDEVVASQWSSFPFALPWSSQSCPFVFGSVRHS